MTLQQIQSNEIEQQRQELIAEMTGDNGPDWFDGYQPGSFGCHELLDRAALLEDLLERHILSHPACVQNQDWYRLAGHAAAALRELYQRVGAEHMGTGGAIGNRDLTKS